MGISSTAANALDDFAEATEASWNEATETIEGTLEEQPHAASLSVDGIQP